MKSAPAAAHLAIAAEARPKMAHQAAVVTNFSKPAASEIPRYTLLTRDQFANCDKRNIFQILSERQQQLMDMYAEDHTNSFHEFNKNKDRRTASKFTLLLVSFLVTVFGILGQTKTFIPCVSEWAPLISTLLAAGTAFIASLDAFWNFSEKRNEGYNRYVSLGRSRDYFGHCWAVYVVGYTPEDYERYENAVRIIFEMHNEYFHISSWVAQSLEKDGRDSKAADQGEHSINQSHSP